MAAAEPLMNRAAMKKLLALSKQEPVRCAVGFGDDPGSALLMMDKIKPPKAVEMLLTKSVPAAKMTRWGTALVDTDDNPKLVKFILNKPVANIARRLVKTLKGTGYTKVLIVLEDGTEVESAGEEDEEEDTAARQATPAQSDAQPVDDAGTVQDAGALRGALAALIPRITGAAGADVARKAALVGLAGRANAALKGGDLAAAGAAIGELRAALEGPPATSGPDLAARAKAWPAVAQAWLDANDAVNLQMDALRGALLQTDDEELHEIAELGLNAVLGNRRVRIMAGVQGLSPATPDTLAKEGPKLLAAIGPLRAHLTESEQVAACDDNPFGVPVTIRAVLDEALAGMERVLQAKG